VITGFAAGACLIAAGAFGLVWSRRRLRADQIAEHGPTPLRGGLYRSRQVGRG
jgi:hypothetical protein